MSVSRFLVRLLPPMTAAAMMATACGGSSASPPARLAPTKDPDIAPARSASVPPEPAWTPELLAGIKAFDAGSYADALASFEAAAKKNPNDYETLLYLGTTCEKLSKRPCAEAAYKSALAARPDLDRAAADLCALYVDEGRLDDALAVGKAAVARNPGSAALHENLGVALAGHGDQNEATQELGRAIAIQPSEPMFHLTLAHWLNTWHVRGAAPHLDAAQDRAKQDYGMLASIGHEYRMAGEFDACIKTFDRAVQLKDGGEVRTERALCRLGLKDEKATLDDLEAAVRNEPTYAPAHYYLGGRLAVARQFREAAAEYAKYLSIAPDGSLAKPAAERMKAAQAAAKDKGARLPKK
ncbi:MAG: tetratricopeptide repeat protein [Myxococcota bacterium]|nr:tetratricopeptide repeat protein [Myxococcota bacterium]